MHAVHFDKAYVQQLLDAIQTGKPMPTREGSWTGNNMLMLAGVLYAAVMTQGPHTRQALGPAAARLAEQIAASHPERQEAVEEAFYADLDDSVRFLAELTLKLIDGAYDTDFAPLVKGLVYRDAEGRHCVHPHEGFLNH
jgi:hypothetical protein